MKFDDLEFSDNVLLTPEYVVYNEYTIVASSTRSVVFTHKGNDYLLLAKKDKKSYFSISLYKGIYDNDKMYFEAEDILYKSFKFMISKKETLYLIFSSVISLLFSIDVEDQELLANSLAGYFPNGLVNKPDVDPEILMN